MDRKRWVTRGNIYWWSVVVLLLVAGSSLVVVFSHCRRLRAARWRCLSKSISIYGVFLLRRLGRTFLKRHAAETLRSNLLYARFTTTTYESYVRNRGRGKFDRPSNLITRGEDRGPRAILSLRDSDRVMRQPSSERRNRPTGKWNPSKTSDDRLPTPTFCTLHTRTLGIVFYYDINSICLTFCGCRRKTVYNWQNQGRGKNTLHGILGVQISNYLWLVYSRAADFKSNYLHFWGPIATVICMSLLAKKNSKLLNCILNIY